jgi:tRNA-5-taurinomethyluridine 2-sulfurtransferase
MNIAVLVSGGVDSSVALRLLKEQGHTVTAFYLKIWLEDELSFLGMCPWQEDLGYVESVCDQVGVPLEIISFQKEYWDEVVTYTVNEIKAGRTPNPDILCNKRIKFGAFYTSIDQRFDCVATGHYAQIKESHGKILLCTSADTIKDQTYFLSHLNQEQLSRALFPIGHLAKAQVRELAYTYNLATKERKDSQGICFLGKLKFNDFIKYHMGQKQGDLIEYETGKKLGEHPGFWYYTIGQRQGLGLAGGPWYVMAKNVQENIVYISRAYYGEDKERDTFDIVSCNWIADVPCDGQQLFIKLRHGPYFNQGTVTQVDTDRFRVRLTERDQGIAPGQFAVLYDNTVCLGSGIITQAYDKQ